MDRREFLKGTAAAGAAAVLPLSVFSGKSEASQDSQLWLTVTYRLGKRRIGTPFSLKNMAERNETGSFLLFEAISKNRWTKDGNAHMAFDWVGLWFDREFIFSPVQLISDGSPSLYTKGIPGCKIDFQLPLDRRYTLRMSRTGICVDDDLEKICVRGWTCPQEPYGSVWKGFKHHKLGPQDLREELK